MKSKDVRIAHKRRQQARLQLVEAETALLMAACEEFQTWETIKKKEYVESSRFRNMWLKLTPAQQNELRPELWGDVEKFIDAPRKRPDMTVAQFAKALYRRGFNPYSKGIQIRKDETIGFVYRRWPDWGPAKVDRRESLKRAIEWAAKTG